MVEDTRWTTESGREYSIFRLFLDIDPTSPLVSDENEFIPLLDIVGGK